MDDNILPELNHCSLNKIGLTIKLLNLGDIYTFLKKAISPPPVKSVFNVIDTLKGKYVNYLIRIETFIKKHIISPLFWFLASFKIQTLRTISIII